MRALLAGGFDPSEPCDPNMFRRDDRGRGAKELPLPEDWAQVRGHTKVVDVLRRRRRELRPDRRRKHLLQNYSVGKLATFFPDRQYGFISTPGSMDRLGNEISKDMYIHLSTLRKESKDSGGYQHVGQKLCFLASKDGRGREKATHVVSGEDFSYMKLPYNKYDAESNWPHYNREGSDESAEDESSKDDHPFNNEYCEADY